MPAPMEQPSFSPAQRWKIGFRVFLTCVMVLLVVVMANYLASRYFSRFYLGSQAKVQISPRTHHFLKTLTNQISVTLYYDRSEPLYNTISDLLKEYSLANPRITVQSVDYLRDPAAAQKVKAAFQLDSAAEKNLVIFQADGTKWRAVDGNALAQYTLEQIPSEEGSKVRRAPVAFLGDMAFTAALLHVTNPKPMTAYFLQGHREHDINSGDEVNGYLNFASYLKQSYIRAETLTLSGTNRIPSDCNLLIVAGPLRPLLDTEVAVIDEYLSNGGRLLALFNPNSVEVETGMERLLAKWGVSVGRNAVVDPDHSQFGSDVIVSAFHAKHPATNPLLGTGLYLIQPRTISKLAAERRSSDAPEVDEIAQTGPGAYLHPDSRQKRTYPVMVAVSKGTVKGVVNDRGTTRMIVVGDSIFLGNKCFDLLGNRDFAGYAVNWLLDRTQLLEGIGPRPVKEYRLTMSNSQVRAAQWFLLAGIPGTVLVAGGLIWLRRRG